MFETRVHPMQPVVTTETSTSVLQLRSKAESKKSLSCYTEVRPEQQGAHHPPEYNANPCRVSAMEAQKTWRQRTLK